MELASACRCCLSVGLHKDLNTSYTWLDNKIEVYSEMLQECFNIMLSSHQNNSICDMCIVELRRALTFKQNVLQTEKEFLQKIKASGINEGKVEVKLEIKNDSDNDSDDYFLADAVNDISIHIKEEENEKPPKSKANKKLSLMLPLKKTSSKSVKVKQERNWRVEKIKSLVTKLASISSTPYLPEVTITKKSKQASPNKKIPVNRKPVVIRTDFNKYKSMFGTEKDKQKHNLQTILQYSNVTPFMNKSLLGYMCAYCNSQFQDPADLRTHTSVDHENDRMNFKTSFDMTDFNVKIDVTDLKCTLCDSAMDNMNILKEHLIEVHKKVVVMDIKDHMVQYKLKKGEVYDCCMCTSTYETFKMLQQHMNKHYGNYSCNKCDSSFATKRSLLAHNGTHEEGSFKCDLCDKVFSSKAKKQYHEKTSHLGNRIGGICPFCNETFKSYYQRNQHLIAVHNTEAQYKCNICSRAFILKSLLMTHIKKNHLMERNAQCSECGYRFFSKKALKAHMVKHTGERNFSCDVCHKSYARKYTLREHMRIHNNDRRFRCEVCSMTFVQKCSLKSHLLSNHGISMTASEISASDSVSLETNRSFSPVDRS